MPAHLIDHGNPIALALALACAAAMGYAIQHGGTCMVAAVGQVVRERRAGRAIALLECSLWVLTLGLATTMAGLRFDASPGYPAGIAVVIGGALLGLGAWLNDACVFGSIARIGKGDLHFLLTPPGFFLGSLLHAKVSGPFAMKVAPMAASGWSVVAALLLFGASVLFSIRHILANRRAGGAISALWDYRHATIMIGIAFVVLSVVAGPWTYTEELGKAAHGNAMPAFSAIVLFAALLGGAVVGGWRSARFEPFVPQRALMCVGGGILMGLGGALVPGGNDNLILVGLPQLQPHAWLAITAMVLAIAAALRASATLRRLRLVGSNGRKEQT